MDESKNQTVEQLGIDLNEQSSLMHDYATVAVPLNKRRGFYGTAMVWVGWCISLSAFMTGGPLQLAPPYRRRFWLFCWATDCW